MVPVLVVSYFDEVEMRDTGLSDDWKRYTLVTQIVLLREVLEPATQ